MTQKILNLFHSDESLVKRIKQSNSKAFKLLFERYHAIICSYIYTRIDDKSVTEDLAQEVFIKLWNNREKLDASQSIKSYLFTSAKHLLIDRFRKKQLETVEINEQIDSVDKHDINTDSISDQILELLEQLPYDQKVTFLLHRLDGLSYKELSESFGVSVKAIEKRISTVLKFLREHIVTNH